MAFAMIFNFFIFSVLSQISCASTIEAIAEVSSSQSTPFLWGVATAAYQIEGAVHEEGRGDCIWDVFTHIPNKIAHNHTGDVACDSYHHVEEDMQLLKELGVNAYRFSISWSRIYPFGHSDHLNLKGIEHYNKLIDMLIEHKIEPIVTLYHWDLPQSLENDYGGLLHPTNFQQDFVQFAKICFQSFGDRVKKWITINEPWTISALGYGLGLFAPGRCSYRERCSKGNSTTESYIVAHNLLNAHAAVVEVYRKQYKPFQKGQIGITLNHDWAEPYDASNVWDQKAAEYRREFQLGWFADPIFFGHYPQSMTNLIGDGRLPKFTEDQSKLLQGSIDFLGLNHYTSKYYLYRDQDVDGRCRTNYIDFNSSFNAGLLTSNFRRKYPKDLNIKQVERDFRKDGGSGWYDDQCNYETKYGLDGNIIGIQAESSWLNVVPWGFYKLLKWVDDRYYGDKNKDVVPIYITENGCDVPNEATMPKKQILKDSFRISYYQQYLQSLDRAMNEGVNIKGYFAWSLLDNFEWADGYDKRFGLHYVDFKDPNRPRYAKNSAIWYGNYIRAKQKNGQVDDGVMEADEDMTAKELLNCDSSDHQCSWLAFLSAAVKNSFDNPIHSSISFEE